MGAFQRFRCSKRERAFQHSEMMDNRLAHLLTIVLHPLHYAQATQAAGIAGREALSNKQLWNFGVVVASRMKKILDEESELNKGVHGKNKKVPGEGNFGMGRLETAIREIWRLRLQTLQEYIGLLLFMDTTKTASRFS